MYQISKTSVNRILNAMLGVALAITLLGIAADFRNTLRHGGNDLRNRIVGARLLTQGIDPYYYRWQPGDPETLRDPLDRPEVPVSRVTAAPIGLAVYVPFASFPYHIQRWIWFVLQQAAFFGSLALLIFSKTNLRNKEILVASLLVMNTGYAWRLHVETGQIYIFYVFLIALFYKLLSQKIRFNQELSGLALGLAIAMRPPLIVVTLPMLLFKQLRLFMMTMLGAVIWLLLSLVIFGPPVWLNYFSAMTVISKLSRGEIVISERPINLPQVLEDVAFGVGDASQSHQTSWPLLLKRLLDINLSTSHLIFIIVVIFSVYSFVIFKLYKSHSKDSPPLLDVLLMTGGVMLLVVDFSMPVPRFSYNDVYFLIPLIPVLKHIQCDSRLEVVTTCLLGLSIALMGGLFAWLPINIAMGQLLTLFTLIAMTMLILRKPYRRCTIEG
jgi:hypothetical protein